MLRHVKSDIDGHRDETGRFLATGSQKFALMEALVSAGWFQGLNDLMLEAVRRLLDAHRPELMERFVREDIEWGLRGDE